MTVARAVILLALPLVAALSPVVIIPGDGSNQLEARLDKKTSPHFYCSKTADWYRLWLDTADLLAATTCWTDNIRLVINESDGRASNVAGVETRVPYWGTTDGFEELDPSLPAHSSAAFRNMVLALQEAGYTKNTTLRGAPYDFRYTPDSTDYVQRLRVLVEETVEANGGEKATIITHSMGGLQGLYFLQQMTDAWKAKNVRRFVPISAPWVGAAKEARLFATGDNEGIPGVKASTIRDEQRSYETNHWLFPRASSSVWSGKTLVDDGRGATFAAGDSDALFDAVGYPVGKAVLPRVQRLLADPSKGVTGVVTTCLYSSGVDTPISFKYDGDYGKDPVATNGDGDGTVNIESLRVCDGWPSTTVQRFTGLDHTAMITDASVIAAIVQILAADDVGDAKSLRSSDAAAVPVQLAAGDM